MNLALWAVQAFLAFAFVSAGGMKLAMPIDDLAANGMTFVNHAPAWLVRFIGLSEVLGAVGLIVPWATNIQPKLTALAAALLGVVMGLAMITHLSLGEPGAIVPNIVLGGLSAFVAWGRTARAAQGHLAAA